MSVVTTLRVFPNAPPKHAAAAPRTNETKPKSAPLETTVGSRVDSFGCLLPGALHGRPVAFLVLLNLRALGPPEHFGSLREHQQRDFSFSRGRFVAGDYCTYGGDRSIAKSRQMVAAGCF